MTPSRSFQGTRSLRVRLALWQACLLAATLIALSMLTLILLRNILNSRADTSLFDYADTTARNVARILYENRTNRRPEPNYFLDNSLQEWGRQIQIVDAHSAVVRDRSEGLSSHRLPTDMDARVNGLKGVTTYQTRTDLGEHPVRIVTVPVQLGKDVPYLVQSAASLEGVEDALGRTSVILLIITPCVFVLSLLGGWVFVARSLKPVDAMTRTAMSMEPGKLHTRVEPIGADDEISRLANAFNEMISRLDRSFRQVKQFSGDASHELKTPLTSIRGEAEVALLKDLTVDQHRSVLTSIVADTERMTAIVDNLLLLTRADADQIEIETKPVNLVSILFQVYEQMEGIAHRKGINLDMGEVDDATVLGDSLWLGQITTNLVNNAIKYTPSGGSVFLSIEIKDQKSAVLSVRDTGPGIAEEHLPRLFDRFYRVDAGRGRDTGGVGLGLNIAQWAAVSMGGEITVTSKLGAGTTFAFTIQLANAE